MNKIREAVEARKKIKIVGKYGVTCLDDQLGGIISEDFVLIGAESGCGKTELAYQIAIENSKKINVHLVALEAETNEVYLRALFKEMAKLYFEEHDKNKDDYFDISYRNYILEHAYVDEGIWNSEKFKKYEEKAIPIVEEKLKNVYIHNRSDYLDSEGNFTIGSLKKAITGLPCDLLIIDHVDYFDLNDEKNENVQMTRIMKELRAINQEEKLPLVVVSHLRKK